MIDDNQIPSPCFVIYEEKLRANLALIKNVAQAAEVEIILAFKGFAMWKTFPIVKEYIQGVTASSVYEAKLCNEEMQVLCHTYCVAIAQHEIDELLSYSSHITFNSLHQYNKYKVKANSAKVSMGLRVNPQFSKAKVELYNPGSAQSRLGLSPDEIKDGLPEGIDGLHFHVLCENNSYDLAEVWQHFEKHYGHLLPKLKWLNMGGGHLITHKEYDTEHLIQFLKKIKAAYPNLHIILEPGSAFAWQTGVLKSTVLDIVDNGGMKTAILDISFTAHTPDCLEMPYKPTLQNESENGKYKYRLGGTSCLAGDYIDGFAFENPLQIGDVLIFEDMIHYTMVKTSTFNGVKHPSLGMINKNNTFELFAEIGYNMFKQKLS